MNRQTLIERLEIASKNIQFSYYHKELLKEAAAKIKTLARENEELTYLLAKEKERSST